MIWIGVFLISLVQGVLATKGEYNINDRRNSTTTCILHFEEFTYNNRSAGVVFVTNFCSQ